MVDSIAKVGLKKPITVSRNNAKKSEYSYDLVCGQGRLEAFQSLRQETIPAFVVEASEEECLIMSLVENIARRQHSSIELMQSIGGLENRGYSIREIADKTGLSHDYVRLILHLLNNGEERLIAAVERNQMPINVAVEIANAEDKDVQNALAEAYERKELRGAKLKAARRIVELRQQSGKTFQKTYGNKPARRLTANAMVRAFKQESARQQAMVSKANETERRLLFIATSLKALFSDSHFVTLLRAEKLETVPKQLADLINEGA